jgi:riboflavin-specific deaminase-like protein
VTVKRLLPLPAGEVDAVSQYSGADRRPRPERPYVMVNMVASVDGATATDGVTKGFGSPTDRAIFLHLRDEADAILVGASTVRAEGYGPARTGVAAQEVRLARGQTAKPAIAVVTRSVDLDFATALWTESDPAPVLMVPADTDAATLERARSSADVVAVGAGSVDLRAGLTALRGRGINLLLCEGGPTLNGQLLSAGLVDELLLTAAPLLSGGASPRGIFGAWAGSAPLRLNLAHVLEEDSYLYLRYLRPPGAPPA